MDNGQIKEEHTEENPFQKDTQKYTREQLMKMTISQLAPMAKEKSHLMLSTLKGKSKAELADIILSIEETEKKTHARTPRVESESDNIINFAIDTLESIKKARGSSEINPIAKEIFKSSAVNKVDEKRADGTLSSEKFNNVLMYCSAFAVVVDSIIGFENIPGIFQKMKSKLNKKKDNDTK